MALAKQRCCGYWLVLARRRPVLFNGVLRTEQRLPLLKRHASLVTPPQ